MISIQGLTIGIIQKRLVKIFPKGTGNQNYLTREMAAKVVFVCLYADAISGKERWVRPNQICRMTDLQSDLRSDDQREKWYSDSMRNGFSPIGPPWFADTTREPIRDETIGEGFLPVRAMVERADLPTTSSKPRYALDLSFSELFDASLQGDELQKKIEVWQSTHISKAALTRQAILSSNIVASANSVNVVFPSGETRVLSPGISSQIAKAVIEIFAKNFLRNPQLLWLSEPGNKVVARDENLASSLGIKISPEYALPDIILVDLGDDEGGSELKVVFVEVVATDGPINNLRKESLTAIAITAGFDEEHLSFLTVFSDRSTAVFKKSISEIAWGTYVWLMSEPNQIIDFRDGNIRSSFELVRTY